MKSPLYLVPATLALASCVSNSGVVGKDFDYGFDTKFKTSNVAPAQFQPEEDPVQQTEATVTLYHFDLPMTIGVWKNMNLNEGLSEIDVFGSTEIDCEDWKLTLGLSHYDFMGPLRSLPDVIEGVATLDMKNIDVYGLNPQIQVREAYANGDFGNYYGLFLTKREDLGELQWSGRVGMSYVDNYFGIDGPWAMGYDLALEAPLEKGWTFYVGFIGHETLSDQNADALAGSAGIRWGSSYP